MRVRNKDQVTNAPGLRGGKRPTTGKEKRGKGKKRGGKASATGAKRQEKWAQERKQNKNSWEESRYPQSWGEEGRNQVGKKKCKDNKGRDDHTQARLTGEKKKKKKEKTKRHWEKGNRRGGGKREWCSWTKKERRSKEECNLVGLGKKPRQTEKESAKARDPKTFVEKGGQAGDTKGSTQGFCKKTRLRTKKKKGVRRKKENGKNLLNAEYYIQGGCRRQSVGEGQRVGQQR